MKMRKYENVKMWVDKLAIANYNINENFRL